MQDGSMDVVDTPEKKTPPLSSVDQLIIRRMIQVAQVKLDKIHSEAGDEYTPEEQEAAQKTSDLIEWLTKQVEAITKQSDSKAKSVNVNEIPRFQLVGQATRYWPDRQRFPSVDHFFSEFENIICASGNDIELVWKRYIPIALPFFDFESWTKNDLLKCADWNQAKALFRKHFGAPVNTEEAMAKLFSMRMKAGDTTSRTVASLKDSNMLARFYQFTLLRKNQQLMVNQMGLNHNSDYAWTINEIYHNEEDAIPASPLSTITDENVEVFDWDKYLDEMDAEDASLDYEEQA
ncbi:hypothetical protein MBANPS3_000266 [Mucor bainieri]